MTNHTLLRRLVLPMTLLPCALGATGCEQSGSSSDAAQTAPAETVETKTYQTRGRVAQKPTPESPLSEFMIHHEEIPEFEAKDGSLGMNEMTMPFPLGEGVSIDSFNPGDAVEFEFNVDWTTDDGTPAYYITRIGPLAEGEELNLTQE